MKIRICRHGSGGVKICFGEIITTRGKKCNEKNILSHDLSYNKLAAIADLFSQLNPYFISVDSLTLFPDTELYQMVQQGLFVPAEEKERIRELQILINNLNIRTHLFANTVSNFTPVTAYLPYDREKVTNELQFVLDNTDEREMQEYRNNLKSLG